MTSDEMEEGQSSFYDGDNNNDGHTFRGGKGRWHLLVVLLSKNDTIERNRHN